MNNTQDEHTPKEMGLNLAWCSTEHNVYAIERYYLDNSI